MIPIKCPNCQNDNPSLIETVEHRREYKICYCIVCGKEFVHKFERVPVEKK
jgi:hypothetical protein